MSRALACGLLLMATYALATRPPRGAVPVVVASVDIPAGTVVTFDMISQRIVAGEAATGSVVKPDSASYIIGQKVLFPVLAGDLMLWSLFETRKDAPTGCAALFKAGSDARKDLARAKKRLLKR